MSKLTGGCYCGDIRYEISKGPSDFYSCYCRDCQYFTGGSPNSAMYLLKHNFTMTKGKPGSYTSKSDAGTRIKRFFCGNCRTPLYGESELFPNSIVIKVGSLDDPSVFKPTMNVWVSSAQDWHYLDPEIPGYDRKPTLIVHHTNQAILQLDIGLLVIKESRIQNKQGVVSLHL